VIQEAEIGKRIRGRRKSRGITLQDLAKKTGFTKGYLSRIENSEKAPPVSTLIVLSKTLDMSVSEIFGERDEKISVSLVGKDERDVIAGNGTSFGYSYQSLAHKFYKKHMEPYIMTLPVSPQGNVIFQHKGEEMLFVLEGTMKFFHGEREFLVKKGDCIYFDTNLPHYAVCQGNKEVKCLMVIYAPE
jgi:transcriptional regulator with XRE-family HTH domain